MKSFKSYILIFEAKPEDLVSFAMNVLEKYPQIAVRLFPGPKVSEEKVKAWLEKIYSHWNDWKINKKYYDWFIKAMLSQDVGGKNAQRAFEWYHPKENFMDRHHVAMWMQHLYKVLGKYDKIKNQKIDSSTLTNFKDYKYNRLTGNIYTDFPPGEGALDTVRDSTEAWDSNSVSRLLAIPPEELVSKREKEKMLKAGAKLIDNVDGWEIYQISSFEANCYYGANTKWCTTSKGNPRAWNNYSNNNTMYIIINPNKIEKWQLAIPNDGDERPEIQDQKSEYPVPGDDIIDILMKSKIEKIKYAGEEIYEALIDDEMAFANHGEF